MASGPDMTKALMAAISEAIIRVSPPNPRQADSHLVDLVAAGGALMGGLALVTKCDPNLRDIDIATVGRNIGDAVTTKISAVRELYKQTGRRMGWPTARSGRTTRPCSRVATASGTYLPGGISQLG